MIFGQRIATYIPLQFNNDDFEQMRFAFNGRVTGIIPSKPWPILTAANQDFWKPGFKPAAPSIRS